MSSASMDYNSFCKQRVDIYKSVALIYVPIEDIGDCIRLYYLKDK
jgi:hypothetical protein